MAQNPRFYDKAGEELLKKAEDHIAEKKRDSDRETDALIKDAASGLVAINSGRITVWGGIGKGKLGKFRCCICSGQPGTYFFMPDGKYYGSCCKHLYGASKKEIEEERNALCH